MLSVTQRRYTVVAAIAMLIPGSGRASAQSPFRHSGFDSKHATYSPLPNEHVDPASGALSVVATDLVLPGNAGFDLRITRIYNSNLFPHYDDDGDTTLEEDSWAGIGWRLHFGRVLNPNSTTGGETSIELGDGSRHALYSTTTYPEGWMSTGFARYDRSNHTLKLPNGYVYTFGHVANLGGSLGDVRYVTEIRDPFANKIEFDYFAAPGPVDGVSQIRQYVSASQIRTVDFTYHATTKALASMTSDGRTWTYTHDAFGSTGHSLLREVKPPLVPATVYEYHAAPGELTRIVTASGGVLTYTYQDAFRKASTLTNRTRVVATRETSGRLIEPGTWTFSYGAGPNEDTTVVACPCNTTRFRFNGTGLTGDFSAWKSGTLAEQTVETGSGTVVERQVFTWIRSEIVSQDAVTGEGGIWSDPAVYTALLDTVTVTRGTQSWITAHEYHTSNFNDFGQPWRTVQSGEFTRTTERTFQGGFIPHILGRIASTWTVVGPEGVGANWEYDPATGFLTSFVGPGSPRIRYTARTDGNIASMKDDLDHETFFENYHWGQPQRIRTPHVTTDFVVNPDGTVASSTTGSESVSYLYDQVLRVTQLSKAGLNAIKFNYDNSAGTGMWMERTQQSIGVETINGFGQTVKTTGASGVNTRVELDACGRTMYTLAPYTAGTGSRWSTTWHDALGRVTQVRAPDNTLTQLAYSGNDVTVTDPEGRSTTYTYSAAGHPDGGRLVSVRDAANQVTTYTYDVLDSLTKVSGPGTIPDRVWVFDGAGRLQSTTQPESGQTLFTYDAAWNLSTTTDANSTLVTRHYDGNNRLTKIDNPGLADDVTVDYDPVTGRLKKQTLAADTPLQKTEVALGYDGQGQVNSRKDSLSRGTVNTHVFESAYGYDANGNLTTLTYPSGRLVTYEYDQADRLTTVRQNGNVFADLFTYDDSGRLASYRTGLVTHTTTYDDVDRPKRITSGSALDLTYSYWDAGNVKLIEDSRPGMNQSFGYDVLNRLTSATGPWGARSWAYWPSGDRASETGPGTTGYEYEPATRRLDYTTGAFARDFTYDNVGQMTWDSGRGTFAYNPAGLVTTFSGANVSASYAYDPAGLRIERTVNGVTNYTIRSAAGSVLSEYRKACGTPVWTRDIIYAGGRLLGAIKATAPEPTVSLTTSALSAGESSGTASLNVQLTTPGGVALTCPVTVSHAALQGSAIDGTDFRLTAGSLTFPTGSANGATLPVTVEILADSADEPDETFSVTLSGVIGGAAGATTSAAVTITDDDPEPTLSVADASTTEGQTLGGVLTFTVSLSAISGKTVSVTYGTANGSAIGGSDFVITSGSLEFAPGEQSKPVVVVLHPDLVDEPYEHLYLQLASPVNATLSDAQGRGTIVDDDGPANTDFNGDGWPDLVWRNLASSSGQHPEDHQNRIWLMADRTLEASVAIDPAFDQQWQIRGVADINGDSKPDLVWQHAGNGQLAAWLYDGTTRIGTPNLQAEPDLNWRVMAAADMNNDGHADLLWQNLATGALRV